MKVTETGLKKTKAGGAMIGERDGQTVIHKNGTMGGYLTGKLHKEGGIKGKVKSTGQPIEMQGGEVVITAPAVASTEVYEFDGKKLTSREILSIINVDGGGVAFAASGLEVPGKIKYSGNKKYCYGGKMMNGAEIASSCGCQHSKESGGTVAKKDIGGQVKKAMTSNEANELLNTDPAVKGKTWQDAGCYPLARAIQKVHGGELVMMVDKSTGKSQHIVVKIGEKYLDAHGMGTERAKLAYFKNITKKPWVMAKFDKKKADAMGGIGSDTLVDSLVKLLSKEAEPSQANDPAIDHAVELLNKTQLNNVFEGMKKKDPAGVVKLIADQALGRDGQAGERTAGPGAKKATEEFFGKQLTDASISAFPDKYTHSKKSAEAILAIHQDGSSEKYMEFKSGGMVPAKKMARGGTFERPPMHIPAVVKTFMPEFQQKIASKSWEHGEAVERLKAIIEKMPKTYQTDSIPAAEKILQLHYFYGQSDWYIVEKDSEPEQLQAYGYVILNGDEINAEWGYISIEELKETNKVELDFHFTPITFGEKFKEEELDNESLAVTTGSTFRYGQNYGIPESASLEFVDFLKRMDFKVVEEKPTIIYLKKDGHEFYINDNGGEFNMGDDDESRFVAMHENIAYDVAKGFVATPKMLAIRISNAFNKHFSQPDPQVEFTERQKEKGTPSEVKMISETISTPTQIPGEEDDIDPNYDAERGIKLKKLAMSIDWLSPEMLKKFGVANYDFRDLDMWIGFTDGSEGAIDLATRDIHDYTANREKLTKVRSFIGELESKTETNAAPVALKAPVVPTVAVNKKQQADINGQIKALLKEKGTDVSKYSADDIALIKLYEGAGGLAKHGAKGKDLFWQFFTPMEVCNKMWGLAIKYGFKFPGSSILEPSFGSCRLLQFIPKDVALYVRGYEIEETAYTLGKVLFPNYDLRHESFEKMFFTGQRNVGLAGVDVFYDLVIGNPPYYDYISNFAKLGEKDATGAHTFEMYFMMRGVDVLKKGGLLIYIIPSSFMSNDNKYNAFKEKLAEKADLLDAYRLPSGVFPNTEVTTDLIVLRKK